MYRSAIDYMSDTYGEVLMPFPTKKIDIPKVNNEKNRFLTREEAELLLTTLYNWREIKKSDKTHFIGKDTKDAYGMALLSLYTGMRLGDIIKMKWKNTEGGIYYVRTPKGGKAYSVHINIPKIAPMLAGRRAMFPDAKPGDYVFQQQKDSDDKAEYPNGKPWKQTPRAFAEAVKHLGLNKDKDDLEKVNFHTCRHTFASWLALREVSQYTIQDMLGHKSQKMTQRYSKLNPEHTYKHALALASEDAQVNVIPEPENPEERAPVQ